MRVCVRASLKTQKQPQLILPGTLLEAWREVACRKATEAQCRIVGRKLAGLEVPVPTRHCFLNKEVGGAWLGKALFGERAGFLGQFSLTLAI